MNHDRHYVRHIIEAGERVVEYTHAGRAAFEADRRTQDAVIRNIQVIGEATGNLTEEFRTEHASIPWKKIKGMRNELIHRYFAIDLELVWDAIEIHIPALLAYLKSIPAFPPPKNHSYNPPAVMNAEPAKSLNFVEEI